MGLVERLNGIDGKRVALLNRAATMDPAHLAARPLPGKWSIGEIIEHLVLAETDVVGDFSRLENLEEKERSLRNHVSYLLVMFILRFGIPVRTPSRAMRPTGGRSLAELREIWDENQRRLKAFVAGLNKEGAGRAIFRHPVAGPITVEQGVAMLDVHLDTHTRQIRRLERLLTR